MSKEFVRSLDFEGAERIRKGLYELAFREWPPGEGEVAVRPPPSVDGGLMLWSAEYYALRKLVRTRPESSFLVQITSVEAGPYAQSCYVPGQLRRLIEEIRELEQELGKMPADSIVYTHYEPTGGLYLFIEKEEPPVKVRAQDILWILGRVQTIAQEALDRSELLFVFAQYEQLVA